MKQNQIDEMLMLAMDLAKSIRESEIISSSILSDAVLYMMPKKELYLELIEEDTTLEEAKSYIYDSERDPVAMYGNSDDEGYEFMGYLVCESIYHLAYNYEAYGNHWMDDELNREAEALSKLLWRVMRRNGDVYFENCGGAYAIVREKESESE